ncbi:MAG: molybdenum ABC transporter ATP-binding protein [Pseudomonadota bacterium]
MSAPVTARIRHAFAGFSLNVAFEAQPGVTALWGRSGAGKTSVLNAIAGLLTPDAGHIAIAGAPVFDSETRLNRPPRARAIGMVFQDGRLFPHLTVAQNLRFAERYAAHPPERDRLVALLGLEALLQRRPASLSGGERQRVAIARALLSAPKILLLDEPLAALDAARKADVLPYLDRLAREGGVPILYVSHALDEVARLADHVVVLRDGESVAEGPFAAVFSDASAIGARDAGAFVEGVIDAHDPIDALTAVTLAGGTIVVPQIAANPGTRVRIRLRATDIILSTTRPEALSTRNILPVTLMAAVAGEGPGMLLTLSCGPDTILARITQRAHRTLGLSPGTKCYAALKAFAVRQEDIIIKSGRAD